MADIGLDVANMREEYSCRPLTEKDLGTDPIMAFERWLKDAVDANEPEPNAMTLATVDAEGVLCCVQKFFEPGWLALRAFLHLGTRLAQDVPTHLSPPRPWPLTKLPHRRHPLLLSAGRPDARIVLLKGVDHEGFRFFTNYNSGKGRDLAANPLVTMVFWWHACNRSVYA
jgi:pyridoxine/pyridoxamine 5'-phosphate oxidase